jgi:hypothetical protein
MRSHFFLRLELVDGFCFDLLYPVCAASHIKPMHSFSVQKLANKTQRSLAPQRPSSSFWYTGADWPLSGSD